MKRLFILITTFSIFCSFFIPDKIKAQDSVLTLELCQELARNNYPLIRTMELIQSTGDYNVSNIKSGYLPSISLQGQYSIQSDVTKLPISLPNLSIPEINKDQYKVYLEISQTVFDGGMISSQKQVAEAQSLIEKNNLQVELYKIKERISQIYFGILLIDAQIQQAGILRTDLQSALKKAETSYTNGILLKSNVDALKAELLKTDQKVLELNAARVSYIQVLGLMINKSLPEDVRLSMPSSLSLSSEIQRPENMLFNSRMILNNSLSKSINAKNLPRVNIFLNGGYGSPALNMLDPDPDTYYIAGLRFIWPLAGLYNIKREKEINSLNLKNIQLQQETFLFNTKIQMTQQNTEIQKFENLLLTDDEIISLRESIKLSALRQLENGVITSSDYIREVNAADIARQAKLFHEIQLMMSKYNFQLITGN